jgi:RNA polymerase sigma-70 factor, ECF subfamily
MWRTKLPDDKEVWKKISNADAVAFDAFYRESAPLLHAFLCHIVGNPQAAEDVAQDAFTQLWLHPNGYQPERGSLHGYLYGIARKRAAEWWRKQTPSNGTITNPVQSVCSTEAASVMGDALARLPEEQRALLWLREVEGQSYAELAVILEIPIGTVRSRLFAAREALRKIWRSDRRSI